MREEMSTEERVTAQLPSNFDRDLENARVLVTDAKISAVNDLLPSLELVMKAALVAIGPLVQAAHGGAAIEELDGAVVNVELLRFPKGGVAPVGRDPDHTLYSCIIVARIRFSDPGISTRK